MYVSEQIDLLGVRLEDPSATKYFEPVRLIALRNAELKIIQHLHNAYLTELQTPALNVAVTAGNISLDTLANVVIRGAKGVAKVRVTGGRWASEIDFRDVKQQESSLYKGSLLNPQYYVWGNSITLDPATVSRADVYYLRMPAPLLGVLTFAAPGVPSEIMTADAGQGLNETINDYYVNAVLHCHETGDNHVVTDYIAASRIFTVTPEVSTDEGTFSLFSDPFTVTALDGVQSELNPSLHELMVTLAEAECWATSREFDRRDSALKSAFEEIATLNARMEVIDGVGTKQGRK